MLLSQACKVQQSTQDFDLICADFAEYLNSESLAYLALKFAGACGGQKPEIAEIKYRIYEGNPELKDYVPRPPTIPFAITQIRAQVAAQQNQRLPARPQVQQHQQQQPKSAGQNMRYGQPQPQP